ncbi:MAG: hypothetical protein ACI9JT_001275 [Polaribacter sp.]|jgi:hypothetical protein
MKNVNIYLVLLTFLFTSCREKQQNILVFKYALETNKTEKYILNTQKNDSILYFEYRNLNNRLALYNLNYIVEKAQVKLKSKTFLGAEENYNFDGFKFKIFQIKEPITGIRTLVFNENYGLLASVRYGENFIFLKDSITPKIKELTFKKIFRSINNLKVE